MGIATHHVGHPRTGAVAKKHWFSRSLGKVDAPINLDTFKRMARTLTRDPVAVAQGFHALSDPTRIEIVELLRSGEQCVCELMDSLDAAQSRLSFHLKVLREARLVTDRREGRWVYYTLSDDTLSELEEFVGHIRGSSTSTNAKACCD